MGDNMGLSNSIMWINVINLLYRPIMWVIFYKPRFIGDNIGLSNKCDNGLSSLLFN